ncbi:uncharacterized protein LOC144642507 isoform X1 [Oculina patagonica]
MPGTCVPSYRCGTHAAGWLRGGHPTVRDGVVSRTVCYHWANNCCWRSNNIQVRNCGYFFVYRLQRPSVCHVRYCGVGYSRPTPTPTAAYECSRYRTLREADRSQAYDYRQVQGARAICDNSLQTGWYRFLGPAGDRMPGTCVPSYRCGTHAAGWLRGGHPTVRDGVVSRTVCYHWANNCCWRSNNIQVRNCGYFFVYRLQRPSVCHVRYCGVGYSRPTPTPTAAYECSRYRTLREADRSQAYDYRQVQGARAICDNSLQTGWYRFLGPAGDRMPGTCVPSYRCGTHAAGWLRGGHPTVRDGVVSRTVCYHWVNNCCWRSNNIQVRNCGRFFVYRLKRPPGCSLRYCGVGYTPPSPTPTAGHECFRYKILREADRSKTYDYRQVQGARAICDNSLQTDWYRFLGPAGDRMPGTCVPSYRCGTHATGWLRGGHPTVRDGVVSRTVCYHWDNNCCWRSNSIQVRNCGRYFVYRLQRPPGCSYRYCGVGYTPQGPTPSSECSRYKVLGENDRAQGYMGPVVKCDRSLSKGWYRFQGLAGKQMPNTCVPKQRCGTHAPGWLSGGHPTVAQGAVQRRVCFHWRTRCCYWSTNIRVRNCGAFYVYELSSPPACQLRYCGDRQQALTPNPQFPECLHYKVLDESDRAQGYRRGVGKCDRTLSKGWYRFQGRAGKQMPDACVPKRRCGTRAPGWLSGGHPTVAQGAVQRTVCFHWRRSCCYWSTSIRVRNCGSFYVYELPPTPYCRLRYCGDRK